jgi:hypothetical protein
MSWTKYFKTTNLTPPRLLVRGKGVIDFSSDKIDEEVLYKLWESGSPYLVLTDAGKEKFLGIKTPLPPPVKNTSKKKRKMNSDDASEEITNDEASQ